MEKVYHAIRVFFAKYHIGDPRQDAKRPRP
jgi:hypothetical protein